ncbi:MAG TPA: hypothetical protein VNR51_12535, partial [Hyphomicrobium sp.]|nr:hypothetical protein [Hyphomicrobium sp.]
LRRHDVTSGRHTRSPSTIIPARTPHVATPTTVIPAQAPHVNAPATVIPAPAPHVDAPTTVTPAQAGIHASFQLKWLCPHDLRRLHARNTAVPFAATNVDAGLRRHDVTWRPRTRSLSAVTKVQATRVAAPNALTQARAPHVPAPTSVIPAQTHHVATSTAVIPAQAPHVDVPTAVIPAQAGIHASVNTRTLENSDSTHHVTRPA